MSKKISSFRIDDNTLLKLKELSKKNNRSQANMVEVLINEEYKKIPIDEEPVTRAAAQKQAD